MDSLDLNTLKVINTHMPGRWGVAVSGGGDSVALLHLCLEAGLPPERLMVLHYNHGWSEAADDWQAGVAALAARLGVEMRAGRSEQAGRPATNAEAVARDQRRAWLALVCKEAGLAGYLTGHTRTDDVEQLLMRLGRGSGLHGLKGIQADRYVQHQGYSYEIHRPLLRCGRDELRSYLTAKGERWIDDPGNADSFRGRVRALLPLLAEAGIGEEAVTASIESLKHSNTLIGNTIQKRLREISQERADGWRCRWDDVWHQLPEMRTRCLETLCRWVTGEEMVPRRSKFHHMAKLLWLPVQNPVTLGGCLWRRYNEDGVAWLAVTREPGRIRTPEVDGDEKESRGKRAETI